ncbi:DUF4397 domain-containing protein [Niastella yeongjuensis]|uniref:DUF4397 domain-containing protein n=1 Tax=Niastella yeongjuensis TaxID=354355 RepID=UPI0015A68832|nr:DUF4397 domain-containing protein [Niastella yeongjuensis]
MQVRKNAFWVLGVLAFVSVALSSCLKQTSNSTSAPKTYISLMHLAPWSPAVEVWFNDKQASSAIAAGSVSTYSALDPGVYAIGFKKAGSDSIVASISNSLYDSLEYATLLLYNIDSTHVGAAKIADDYSMLTNDKAFFRFFHLAPEIEDVDVYFDNNLISSGRSYADNVYSSYYNQFSPVTPAAVTVTVKKSGTDSTISSLSGVNLTQFNAFTIYLRGKKSGTGANAIGIDYLQSVD